MIGDCAETGAIAGMVASTGASIVINSSIARINSGSVTQQAALGRIATGFLRRWRRPIHRNQPRVTGAARHACVS
jgi:hypothetical protein